MEHYISEIKIEHIVHLSDITISLDNKDRQHLLLTGKNGSGKTSVLLAIKNYLQAFNDGNLHNIENIDIIHLGEAVSQSKKYCEGMHLKFVNEDDLEKLYREGNFVTTFFGADRQTKIEEPHGVEEIKLKEAYDISGTTSNILLKYMVHLKTQQSYARNENDMANVDRIQKWFDRFESALRILLDEDSINLEYDYKQYRFKINQDGREPFTFNQLSDGYSSVINIVSDLILRMDKNWMIKNELSQYDIEGIVLIDELETHLHIDLQRKILPFLTEFFPRIQFIVTTHSPYILNSISNAKVYDLERRIEMEDLSVYSSEGIVEGYFEADEYSDGLKKKLERYKELLELLNPSEDERAERAKLRSELSAIPKGLAREARDAFEEIEGRRKLNG